MSLQNNFYPSDAETVKAKRAPTPKTILAAIDHGYVAYLRANKLFVNTRDSFATVQKNALGKKRLVSATTLTRAIYRFAAAPTREAAIVHYAVVEVLLKQCCIKASDEKDGFLRFIMVDAWQRPARPRRCPTTRRATHPSNTAFSWQGCSWRPMRRGSPKRPSWSTPS